MCILTRLLCKQNDDDSSELVVRADDLDDIDVVIYDGGDGDEEAEEYFIIKVKR